MVLFERTGLTVTGARQLTAFVKEIATSSARFESALLASRSTGLVVNQSPCRYSRPHDASAIRRMTISFVIPAFNEERLLPATLAAVGRSREVFHRRGWRTEVVVCDNNSTDRTSAIAAEHGATVVFEPVNQIGRARNTGAGVAKGDWIIFIDADSLPSDALLDDVAAVIEGGRVLAGGSTVRIDHPGFMARFMTLAWNTISRVCGLAAGSFIFCQTQLFRDSGGFDQRLYAGEELDLFQRLKKLARQRGGRFTILTGHPLLTSARKLHLYSWGEHLMLLARTFLTRGRNLKSRTNCAYWYDGRR